MCVQSLGPSIDILKALGPLLEAGFTGREDKPQAIVEAFRDYWDLTYAEVPVPKDGWPTPVITCLEACEIKVTTAKPTLLLAGPIDVAATEKIPVPTLAPAFTWSSSSTIVADEDNASDVTETSQDSNPFAVPTKEAELEPPSTPKASLATIAMSSPRRPSKTATTIRREDIFSPLAPAKLDFVVTGGSASSPSSSSPSRLPRTRSPLRSSPKKVKGGSDKENTPPKPPSLPSLLGRIAMASSGTTPALGKRRASNALNDSRPAKKHRGGQRVAGKPSDNDDDNDCGAATTEDDSEIEREEVQQSLLRPVTPSPAAQHLLAAGATAFSSTVPRALPLPFPRSSSSRSPSPTPQPASHKRKRKGVFMDAVEVPGPGSKAPPRRNQPPRRCASLHMTRQRQQQQQQSSQTTTLSTLTLEASMGAPVPVPPSPSPPAVRRNLRRAKSLVDVMMNAGVPERSPVTPARRPGKRQKVSATSVVVKKAKKAWAKKSFDDINDDDSVVAAGLSSSSPISASLKRAQVLFGSGKSVLPLCPTATPVPPPPPSFFFFWFVLADGPPLSFIDDSMADAVVAGAEMDYPGGAARPACESSDDDPHLGQVTPHHIFSPAPRRLSSRFFTIHDKA